MTRVVQRCSNLVIVLAREEAEVYLHALRTMTELFQLCEWGFIALEICIVVRKLRLDHWMQHLITQPVHVLPCSNSVMKDNMRPTEYCTTILLPKTSHNLSVFHCWYQELRVVGFLGCSPNVNSSWCREQREGRLVWQNHARVSSSLMSRFYSLTPSFTHASNCSPTVPVGLVKLTSGSFYGNRDFKM
jgi:hypothetical protein